jgi:cell division protein FtsB
MKHLWSIVSSVALSGIGGYFAYHSIYGKRGYHTWQHNRLALKALEKKQASMEEKSKWLAQQTRLLQDDSLDVGVLSQWVWEVGRKLDPLAKVILLSPEPATSGKKVVP